jgi:hypothetical protein
MNADDDQVRALLDEAVSDVEPRRSIDEIRARTATSRSRRRWVWGAGGAVLATAATIAAVAVLSSGPGTTDAGPGPADGGSDSSGLVDESAKHDVYFVGDTSHGPRLFDEPHVFDDGDQVGVLQHAIDGAADDPDYRAYWPDGTTVESVRADPDPGAPVVVDLSGVALTDRPAGVTAAQAELSVQQVAWTARLFGSVRSPVEIHVDGRRVSSLLGVPVTSPVVIGSADDVLAQVQVTTPSQGSTWSEPDPITVEGQAAAFEANVQWELKQGDAVVKQGFTTAEECCTLSPFSFPIPLPAPGTYTLVVHDEDPSGGEGPAPWQDTKEITVR